MSGRLINILLLSMLLLSCTDEQIFRDPPGELTAKLLVLNSASGSTSLSLFDPAAGTFTNHIAATALVPNHLSREDEKLYVSCSGDDRLLCYTIGDSSIVLDHSWVLNEIDDLPDPEERIYNIWASEPWQGLVISSLAAVSQIGVLDEGTGVWQRFDTGSWPQAFVIREDLLYVACTGFSALDFTYSNSHIRVHHLPDGEMLGSWPVSTNPQALDFSAAGELVVLSTGDYSGDFGVLQGLDPESGSLLWAADIMDYPGGLELVGDTAWLAAWGQYDLQPGGAQQGYVYKYSMSERHWLRGTDQPIIVGAGATDLEWTGQQLLVSCFAADAICIIEADTTTACMEAGDGPGALLWLE